MLQNPELDTYLVQISEIVEKLLEAYSRQPSLHTMAPFIALLQAWQDALTAALDMLEHDDHVLRDNVSVPV